MRAWDSFNIFIRKGRQVATIDAFPENQGPLIQWTRDCRDGVSPGQAREDGRTFTPNTTNCGCSYINSAGQTAYYQYGNVAPNGNPYMCTNGMFNWRHFRFLMDNGPFRIHDILGTALQVEADNAVSNMKMLQNVLLALMIVEGVFVLPLFAIVMLWTMRRLQSARISLFSVFLCVPRPAIIALASRDCNLDEDESDDDDIDEVSRLACPPHLVHYRGHVLWTPVSAPRPAEIEVFRP